jgi:uncharacterized protein with PQ loop repeat
MSNLLFLIASLCTGTQVVVGLPLQAWRIIKRRSAGDLSRAALALQASGFIAWATAATSLKVMNYYILIPNSLGGALSLSLLVLSVIYRDRDKEVTQRHGEESPASAEMRSEGNGASDEGGQLGFLTK